MPRARTQRKREAGGDAHGKSSPPKKARPVENTAEESNDKDDPSTAETHGEGSSSCEIYNERMTLG
jgi:hypothetical protein